MQEGGSRRGIIVIMVVVVAAIVILTAMQSGSANKEPRSRRVEATVVEVDAAKRLITGRLPNPRLEDELMTVENVRVADDCVITVNGTPATLTEVREGDRMTAEVTIRGTEVDVYRMEIRRTTLSPSGSSAAPETPTPETAGGASDTPSTGGDDGADP
jgi:hypothetical protein